MSTVPHPAFHVREYTKCPRLLRPYESALVYLSLSPPPFNATFPPQWAACGAGIAAVTLWRDLGTLGAIVLVLGDGAIIHKEGLFVLSSFSFNE